MMLYRKKRNTSEDNYVYVLAKILGLLLHKLNDIYIEKMFCVLPIKIRVRY